MTEDDLLALGAWQLSQRLARREIRAEDLVRACLAHIGEREADLQAFVVVAVAALAPQAVACTDAGLPADFDTLVALQKATMAHEAARALAHERLQHRAHLSPALRSLLDDGLAIDGATQADALFAQHDVLLAPSTTGTAPAGLQATGDPLFCRAWTLLGLPCVHLPFTRGANGLPLGLQLVGRHGEDHRLLAIADWAMARLLPWRAQPFRPWRSLALRLG